ncbi:MAG: hypothetical protein H6734_15760 [Alphaproteobacteria bacterium]|nr:hypothetical protein [Alphaproteobacteria bacterium]
MILRTLFVLLLGGCVARNDNPAIPVAMQGLATAWEEVAAAQSTEDLEAAVAHLRSAVDAARSESYEGSAKGQRLYQEGMEALDAALSEVEGRLEDGDPDGARAALDAVDEVHRRYHIKLWI